MKLKIIVIYYALFSIFIPEQDLMIYVFDFDHLKPLSCKSIRPALKWKDHTLEYRWGQRSDWFVAPVNEVGGGGGGGWVWSFFLYRLNVLLVDVIDPGNRI